MKWIQPLVLIANFAIQPVFSIVKCISIYGLETDLHNFVCSWKHPVEYYIEQVSLLGFNTIRVPFALQYVEENNFANMDTIVQESAKYNISIILDMHRTFYDHQDFSPFEHGVTKERFINGWLAVLQRYYNSTNVIGCNVWNEYQGTDAQFLINYTKEVLSYMEYYFPNRFLYYVTGIRWSGSLEGVSLEDLPFHKRIFYSLHKYVFSGTQNPDSFDYEHDWDLSMPKNLTPKLIIGEFGFKKKPDEIKWARRFIKYLKSRKIYNGCFWTIAYSGDTDGLWLDDCDTVDYEKFAVLQLLWQRDRKYLRQCKLPD